MKYRRLPPGLNIRYRFHTELATLGGETVSYTPQISVTGNGALASAVSHVCSSFDRSTRYWIPSCRTLMPSWYAKVAARASTSGSPAWRGGVNTVAPRPSARTEGVTVPASFDHDPASRTSRCAWVRFDSGRKMLPLDRTR